MRVLGTDVPLLLWGAERPFQIQLLGALARLGIDVTALCSPEGKALVDLIHPKNFAELRIPEIFQGAVVWAPDTELFSNSNLSNDSLTELESVMESASFNSKIKECFLLLPQESFGKIKIPSSKIKALYFPALVGFGDKNVFDKLLDQILSTNMAGNDLEGEFLSLFDAVSIAISYFKLEETIDAVWATGQSITSKAIKEGFEEIKGPSVWGPIHYTLLKLLKKEASFNFTKTDKPKDIPIALDIFPTVLSSWERFFRDSNRTYTSTADSSLLLHFRPTKTP